MSIASEETAGRIRALIGHKPGITETKMFGGVGFMLYGNMVAGAMKSGAVLLRVGPERHQQALQLPGATTMVHGGRAMVGFVEVTDDGIADDDALAGCLAFAEDFVKTLPPKT